MDQVSIKSINKTIFFSILFVISFILAMVGLTYAFFGIIITGNDTASSIVIDVVDLGTVTFLDGNEIDSRAIYPMEENERLQKVFTIKAENNEADLDYDIYLTVFQNNFVQRYENEFTYTLSGNSSAGGNVTTNVAAEVPSSRVDPYKIGSGVLKEGGDTHTYTFTIGLNEAGSNQNYNQSKVFSGLLSVEGKKYTHERSIWGE